LSIITALTKITAAISDADVLIKLCKAGYLNILGDVFEYLYVPAVVISEVESYTTQTIGDNTQCSQSSS